MPPSINAELQRYIAHLQVQLLTEGSEAVHDPYAHLTWVKANRLRRVAIAEASGIPLEAVDGTEVQLAQHQPSSMLDSGVASAIFSPVLEAVLAAGEQLGQRPKRPVLLANSTDVSATPLSRPSAGEHLVFAGAGTYAFCNYWAKIVSLVSRQFHEHFAGATMTPGRLLESCARDHRIFLEACKLVAYCRLNGTAVAFGVLPSTPESNAYRLELLFAMESFAIAHEVGHCFLEERNPGSSGTRPEDEFICDGYALTITRHIGNLQNNWSAFAGAGGVLLFLLTETLPSGLDPKRVRSVASPDLGQVAGADPPGNAVFGLR